MSTRNWTSLVPGYNSDPWCETSRCYMGNLRSINPLDISANFFKLLQTQSIDNRVVAYKIRQSVCHKHVQSNLFNWSSVLNSSLY